MKSAETTSTNFALWFALLAGPLAWTVHELVSYMLVKVACQSGMSFALLGLTLATLALAGTGFLVALRQHGWQIEPPHSTRDALSSIGLLASVLFAFAIVMESLPSLLVSPCL